MREGFVFVYRMTQAEIDAGDADSLTGGFIEVVDTAGQETGKVLETGAAGVTPEVLKTGVETKNNFNAPAAPSVGDDSSVGYTVGSHWIDTTNDKSYIALDVTVGAAVWGKTTVGTIGEIPGLQTELDGKESSFTKNTGFNKNLGTAAGTVSEGDHTHSEVEADVIKAQNTADLSGSPLTAIDDQIFPTNLADVVTDGTFCVRNTPADVAAFGLADHVDGDVLKKVGSTWKRLIRPVAGTTIIWQTVFGKAAIFVDEPVAGNLPVFVNTLDTGEAFSVPYIGTDLPGQISFDGTLLIGNNSGGLTETDFGNATFLFVIGTLIVWIRDTVNPERSGVYNLIVNDAGTGDYTLRRDYNFRSSNSFTDGQTFFVGSGSGGDEANKNYLISLAQQFAINTTSLAIVEGDVANLTTKNLTTTNVVVHEGIYHEIDADGVTINKSNILSNAGFNDGIARTANRVDVYQGTGIAASITNQSFVAGVAAVSNPTLVIDAGVFAVGDLVLITDTPSNNGLFEIGGFAGSTATLRGVGTIATVEDFTRDQLISGTFSGNIRLVNVSVHRTSLAGTAEHGQGNLTPISFKQLATLDEVPSAATEEFSSTIVRFFGGFGLPDSNPNGTWTLINPAEITLVQDTVFGEANKQVVSVKDTTGAIQTSMENFVSSVDFQNAFDFGAEFGGIIKCITPSQSDNYFALAVGISGIINPTASSADQRFAAFVKKDPSTNFIVIDDLQGATNVVLNGTGGVPLVEAGDYFELFVSIDIGFIDPRWIVNGIDVGAATFGNSSNSNNKVTIGSGSSGGVGNDFNVANFGITILEESTTKTISAVSMTASDIQVITPVIERDFELIVPDGFPRPVGSKITVLLNNVGGKFKIRTQNLSSPQSLFNRRRELEKIVNAIQETRFLNIVDNNNVYFGEFERIIDYEHSGVVSMETDSITTLDAGPTTPTVRIKDIHYVHVDKKANEDLPTIRNMRPSLLDFVVTGGGDQVLFIYGTAQGTIRVGIDAPTSNSVTAEVQLGKIVMDAGVITNSITVPVTASGTVVEKAELIGAGGRKLTSGFGLLKGSGSADKTIQVIGESDHEQLGRAMFTNPNAPDLCEFPSAAVFGFTSTVGVLILVHKLADETLSLDSIITDTPLPEIDTSQFNNAGTLQTLASNTWVALHAVFFCQTNIIALYYGVNEYANQLDAQNGYKTEDWEVDQSTKDGSHIGTILCKIGTLTNQAAEDANTIEFINRTGRRV